MRMRSRHKTPSASMLLVALATLVGCSSPPPKAALSTRTLDERRAVEIIRRAVSGEGERPTEGRDVTLSSGKTLHLDVGIQGHEFAIAYVTPDEAEKLGDAIPPRNGQDERLRLIRAGEDGGVRIVLLYQDNYRFDDLEGEAHEQTTIACEAQLSRDVRDFVTHAHTKKFR